MAQKLTRATNTLAATLALILPQVALAQADAAAQRQDERQEEREERQEEREEREERQEERQEQEEDQDEQAEQQEEQTEQQEEAEAAAPGQSQAEHEETGAARAQNQAEQQENAEAAVPAQSQPEQEEAEPAAPAQGQAEQRQDDEAVQEAIRQGRAGADAEAAAALDAAARREAQAIVAREAVEAKLAGVMSELELPLSARADAVARAEDGTNNNVTVTVETITEADIRRSSEEFATDAAGDVRAGARTQEADSLTDLDSILFLGLGAAAVGTVLENGQEVVANTGDRLVTLLDSGEYEVYRDDDVILREVGATIQTETFADGSIRTLLTREDATQVVTIRDASSRILRRARILEDGTEVELFDDLEETTPVDVIALLEQAPMPIVASLQNLDQTELSALLQQEPVYDAGRDFSLRQVREISAVRNLVPSLDINVNFVTDSAAVPKSELSDLVEMGILIEDALAENPGEVFLIEGHADAVGEDAYNLALSDRRAESVALSLVENFNIPPENLVIQGYGEEFLRVPTEASEVENRRASIRRITPLLVEEVASLQ